MTENLESSMAGRYYAEHVQRWESPDMIPAKLDTMFSMSSGYTTRTIQFKDGSEVQWDRRTGERLWISKPDAACLR